MWAFKHSNLEEYVSFLRKQEGRVYINEWSPEFGGPKFPKPNVCWNTQATRDTIRHYVDSIGDFNPLFRDRDYARKTKYSCLIAPPTFILSVALPPYLEGQTVDFLSLYSSDEYEWYNPICEGDEFDWKITCPTDIQVKPSKLAGKMAWVYGTNEFYRHQGGIPIATYKWCMGHYDRRELWKRRGKSKAFKIPEYTEEYIREVYAAQDSEVIRGAEPRFWEDVKVGEELTPVVCGPYTATDSIAYLYAAGEYFMCAHRLQRLISEQTGWGLYIPELKISTEWHEFQFQWGSSFANQMGYPGPQTPGMQIVSWFCMLLNNWMGDDGFLWKLSTKQRAGSFMGDVLWFKAKVVRSYSDKVRNCVDVDCWVENQRNEVISRANATLLLPSREKGPVIYPAATPTV
jgi:acyl dehydratase